MTDEPVGLVQGTCRVLQLSENKAPRPAAVVMWQHLQPCDWLDDLLKQPETRLSLLNRRPHPPQSTPQGMLGKRQQAATVSVCVCVCESPR